MNDREALLRTIAENPDDDTPRLVFADWLQEHGETERAEEIRQQIADGKTRYTDNFSSRFGTVDFGCYRGFATTAFSLAFNAWIDLGPDLISEHPTIGYVEINSASPLTVTVDSDVCAIFYCEHAALHFRVPDWAIVPECIFEFMENQSILQNMTEFKYARFTSEEDADKALSKACIEWAKSKQEAAE